MNTPERWQVELHCHTCFSPDSLAQPEAIIAACRRRGIAKIAITDHNTIAGAVAAARLAPDLVIVGEEIMTTQGEIIAWFVREEVPKGLSPAETLARLHDQGAVIGIPHPLDGLRNSAMGLERTLALLDRVDALEVFNARCLRAADNEAALRLAYEHGKLRTAGSDAHTIGEIGAAVMRMPPFTDAATFRRSLATATFEGRLSGPHVHLYSLLAKRAKPLLRVFGRA
ncbi:MAG: PHP domain-containing protein [Caldilineales bacterium]|nr:PHP domain-containing protein [Caldilineales bacterium]